MYIFIVAWQSDGTTSAPSKIVLHNSQSKEKMYGMPSSIDCRSHFDMYHPTLFLFFFTLPIVESQLARGTGVRWSKSRRTQ